ncbi:hypothetical protein [Alkalihalobacillus pseudalcaliphilus]|uniref:hypothetical protein n=1 Tax=Alkalihalobacillus pseudalcaliphilus TaxID=79884 RepID=UPI00069ED7BF|nr:hypothetical protein [Alkalihalobacillus pseudalcaliphilus]
MNKKILIKRGLRQDLPILDVGEFGFCIDTTELFIGSDSGNILISNKGDHISPSSLNGHLNVNGIEISIYDDSELVDMIHTKIDPQALEPYVKDELLEHLLAAKVDINDLELLIGEFKDSLNNKSEKIHHHAIQDITHLEDVLSSKIDKTDIMPVSNSYVIDLVTWGITEGIPNKPYTQADFEMADTNIQGINAALVEASLKGYTHVAMPKGSYAICYPRTIELHSHMTFHLNRSTFKVIYDSDQRSPFDQRSGNDFYNFIGNSFTFDHVTNSHLLGGTIIGCKADRSFLSDNERRQEQSYGVILKRGSNHCSVKHCTIRDYMGDNISIRSDAARTLTEFNMNLTQHAVDNKGNLFHSTQNLTSRFITIDNGQFNSFIISGFGYVRHTSINTKVVNIHFYSEKEDYIRSLFKRKVYTPITIPIGAQKIRLEFLNETNPAKNMNITIGWGLIPCYNMVEHNEVYNGHRGGITLGGNYNVIQHNIIRDNGFNFYDGKPLFFDSTRYGINQEDFYGDHCVIRNNLIYNTNHGILIGCYSIQIEHNHIYNVNSIAINIYTTAYAGISNNYIYNCKNTVGLMDANFENSHVYIRNNYFQGGTTQLVGNHYDVFVTGNSFIEPDNIILKDSNRSVFRGNHISYSSFYQGISQLIVNKIEECSFEMKGEQREIIFQSYEHYRCYYKNIIINSSTRQSRSLVEKVAFNHATFEECQIKNHIYNQKQRIVTVSNSSFINSGLNIGNINSENEHPNIFVNKCDFKLVSINQLLVTDINREKGFGIVEIKNSHINIENPTFQSLIRTNFTVVPSVLKVAFKHCTIKNSSAQPTIALPLYNHQKSLIAFIFSNNDLIGFHPPNPERLLITYDPVTHSPVEPFSGSFQITDIIYHANPMPGGYVGWVCIKSGIASQKEWHPNHSYEMNDIIFYQNQIYKCIKAGISGDLGPRHDNGSSTDNTIIWEYIGTKAIFRPFGFIEK